MKKLLLLSFTFGLFTFTFSQQYGWHDISANIPGDPDLSDVFFVSDNEGWISNSSQAEIYHTTDGGETFEIQTTLRALEAIYMINQSEGYSGGGSGIVFKTSNGGENWDFFGSMTSLLTDMDFATATQGYCCGNSGAVFSITPQGVENLNSGLASDLAGISSPSIDHVWVCGGSNIVHFDGLSFDFQSGPLGSYNAISFINDQEGWVVGNNGLIGHTENGGETWYSQINPDLGNRSLYDLFFLDENAGWAVGFNGVILKTSNGGENWEVEGVDLTTNFLRGVHFTSPTNGYVVGNGITLLKYTEISGIGDYLESIAFDIFPNPAKDKVQISCSDFKTGSGIMKILYLDGKEILVYQFKKGIENIEIDLSDLGVGMYLCKIIIGDRSSTKKIIKE